LFCEAKTWCLSPSLVFSHPPVSDRSVFGKGELKPVYSGEKRYGRPTFGCIEVEGPYESSHPIAGGYRLGEAFQSAFGPRSQVREQARGESGAHGGRCAWTFHLPRRIIRTANCASCEKATLAPSTRASTPLPTVAAPAVHRGASPSAAVAVYTLRRARSRERDNRRRMARSAVPAGQIARCSAKAG